MITAAFLVTLFIMLIFSLFSRRPMRSLWVFFIIIFLATWTGQLWITPFGPVGWGVAWLPLFLVALFFSFLIFSLLPPVPKPVTKTEKQTEEGAALAFGILFWVMVILLLASIITGYYRSPYLTSA